MKTTVMQRWPALPLAVQRHVDRYPYLHQPLYDLLAVHAYAKSTDPRDRVFALLGLLHPEEREFLQRSFPDYNLSEEQVNIITLAHVKCFAGDRPLEPILRTLGIVEPGKIRRVLQIVESVDYIDSYNIASDIEYLVSDRISSVEDEWASGSSSCVQRSHSPDCNS